MGYWPGESPTGLGSVKKLLALASQAGEVIKDDHRSLVKVLSNNGKKIVAKQPRDKNRRNWIRLLTLVRDSEVRHSLRSLSALQKNGVETVTPIAAIERRRWAVVTDSWLFYYYRDGRPCREDELHMVIDTLRTLHRGGFRHEDPHIKNFLYDGQRVFVIAYEAKLRRGQVSDYYEALFLKRELGRGMEGDSDIVDRLHIDTSSAAFWLASAYQRYQLARHRTTSLFRKSGISRYRTRFKTDAGRK